MTKSVTDENTENKRALHQTATGILGVGCKEEGGFMRLLITLGLALLLAGCGNDNPLASSNVNVNGTWQGTLVIAGQRQTLRLSLFQRDVDITGNWAIGEQGGSLGGQMSGTAIMVTLRDATSCQVNITANVIESRMTGTYGTSALGCGGASSGGSIDLTRL